ncbi:MAG: rhomboid family intramembrane serine protease [Bacteroidota bacterium]
MSHDLKALIRSSFFPGLLVLGMLAVKIFEISTKTHLTFLGIYPLKVEGLIGIITSPFIHDDWAHLYANAIPFLILGTSLFYFYRKIAITSLLMIWLLTGCWVWLGAREAWHIGASGILYGLTTFVFTSGLIRKDARLMALSMLVLFLYGGMVWGVFPDFFPNKQISWEAHLWGGIAGVVVAIFYRSYGPQRKLYSWETGDDEVPAWFPGENISQDPNAQAPTLPEFPPQDKPKQDPPQINYIYVEGKNSETEQKQP